LGYVFNTLLEIYCKSGGKSYGQKYSGIFPDTVQYLILSQGAL